MTGVKFGRKKLMTDDVMKLLKFFASDLLESKITKTLMWIVLIIQGSVTAIQTYFIAYVCTQEEIINYIAVYGATPYNLVSILTYLFKGNYCHNVLNGLPLWSIDTGGEKARSRVKQEIEISRVYVLLTLFLTVLAVGLFAQELSKDEDYFFALWFFRHYVPKYSTLLVILYKSTYIFIAYSMLLGLYQTIYLTQHFKVQLILFEDYISDIGNYESYADESSLFDNEEYQKETQRRMIWCIIRVQELLHSYLATMKVLSNLIIAYAISGCLICVCIIFSILSGNLILPEYYFRLGVTAINATIIFCGFIHTGQSVESEGEDITELLTEVCWYHFNKRNRKLYLIFLVNVMKKRSAKFSENYSINYELGLAIVKAIYSVTSAFLAINAKNLG